MIVGAGLLLKEIETHGNIVLTPKQKARVDRLIHQSNSLREFVQDMVVPQKDVDLTTEELLEAYQGYCVQRDLAPLVETVVVRDLPGILGAMPLTF